MTHVFIAPHPDDVALSCGGLIASLRELGQKVAIVTVFSGSGEPRALTEYQREALGFGSKTVWPTTQAFDRGLIANDFSAGSEAAARPAWAAIEERLDATQAEADEASKRNWQRASWYRRAAIRGGGTATALEVAEAAAAADLMSTRRNEDEQFAYFAEVSTIFLDLPDAVFRGYEGDEQLLGAPRADDDGPYELLRREIERLEPERVYFPLGVGGHVDHQLLRNVGLRLTGESRQWVMPGPGYVGRIVFYEDFPYAWWNDFSRIEDLPAEALNELPADVSLAAEVANIGDQLERKIRGIALYASQMDRLFGGTQEMAEAVRGCAARTAAQAGTSGAAERYWVTTAV